MIRRRWGAAAVPVPSPLTEEEKMRALPRMSTTVVPLVREIDTLGDLGAALEAQFGPGIEALVVVRRPSGPRWSSPRPLPQPESVVRPVAARVLDLARVPHRMLGRGYLEDALCVLASAYPRRPRLVAEVYPAVAGLHGESGPRVERDIRYAIYAANRCGGETARAVIGERMTNAHVLYRLLAMIQDDLIQGSV